MSATETLSSPFRGFSRAMDYLSPLFDLGIRLWIANIFFKAGLSKIQSWDSTLMLFEYEYEVPLLSPKLAAYLGTGAELVLPISLALGLAGRLSALALSLFNVVAVIAYSAFLFSDEGTVGLQQHIYWGLLLLVTLFHGPGKLSLDHLLARRYI